MNLFSKLIILNQVLFLGSFQFAIAQSANHQNEEASQTNVAPHPEAAQNTGPNFKDVQYDNCTNLDDKEFQLFHGTPKIANLSETQNEEGTRKVSFNLKNGQSGTSEDEGAPITAEFGIPHVVSPELTIWKGKAQTVTEFGEKIEKSISYIEQKGYPGRKLYVIQDIVIPRKEFYGNDEAKGPGTYYGLTVFDNRGNFTALGSEIDSSIPPQKVYKVHLQCKDKKTGDLFGFNSGDLLANSDDPAMIKGIDLGDIPVRKLKKDKFGGNTILRSVLSNPNERTNLAKEILADSDNLSPARKRFANNLLDGSYKESPLWKLKNLILDEVKYVAPSEKDLRNSDTLSSESTIEPLPPTLSIGGIIHKAEVIDTSDRSKLDPVLRQALEGLDKQIESEKAASPKRKLRSEVQSTETTLSAWKKAGGLVDVNGYPFIYYNVSHPKLNIGTIYNIQGAYWKYIGNNQYEPSKGR